MVKSTPLSLQSAGALQATEEQPSSPPGAAGPTFDGSGEALWVGFGAFIAIFVFVLLAIIRGRVIKPAEQKAKDRTVFEPAGADAEITFDPIEMPGAPEPAAVSTEPEEGAAPMLAAERAERKKSGFANLFRKSKPREAEEQFEPGFEEDNYTPEADDYSDEGDLHQEPDPHEAALQLEQEREERIAREREEAAEREAYERAVHDQAMREADFERRKAEAALEQRMASISAMQRKLADNADALKHETHEAQHQLSDALERRLDMLSRQLDDKISLATEEQRAKDDRKTQADQIALELSDTMSREIAAFRRSTDEAFAQLTRRIEAMESAAPGGAAALQGEIAKLNALLGEKPALGAAGRIQLNDIVAAALPPDRYVLAKPLSTGGSADCLVKMPPKAAPVAIDARFPVEAFDAYWRARTHPDREARARDEYRRTVLRDIVRIAETLIAAKETADFAIMFTPSEAIYNDLHADLPDVIQDAYRARVWILSPTSLMASLHMMSALTAAWKPKGAIDLDAIANKLRLIEERLTAVEESKGSASAKPTPQAPAPAGEDKDAFLRGLAVKPAADAAPTKSGESGAAQESFPLRTEE